MLLSVIRSAGALLGFLFGFQLGAALLQVTDVTEASNRVTVVVLLGIACAILGWLGAPYVTVQPVSALARRVKGSSFGDLLGGAVGGAAGLLLALLIAFPLSLLPGETGRYAPLAAAVLLGFAGALAGSLRHADLAAAAHELRAGRRERDAVQRMLLDTSVIIDGRIADVVKSGFIRGTLLLPRFILAELQLFADSGEPTRRERGRRGLEMLSRMQRESTVKIEVIDNDPPVATADAKLVSVARSMGVPVITNDYGLNRVAELQGVHVLNVNDLARALRPVVLPGEDLSVRVIQEGKERGQGVGYLEDGTMIVVETGDRFIGSDVTVTVMRVLQTGVGGRMVFAQPKGDLEGIRRVRAALR